MYDLGQECADGNLIFTSIRVILGGRSRFSYGKIKMSLLSGLK